MGKGMAGQLMSAGYHVNVYNRTKEKAHSLVENGAEWFPAVKSLAEASDIIITMVGYPKDVEEVYFNNGILDHAKPGSFVIDMTTSSPKLAEKIYQFSSQSR